MLILHRIFLIRDISVRKIHKQNLPTSAGFFPIYKLCTDLMGSVIMRIVDQEVVSMYNVAEESLRGVVVRVANNLHTNSFVRRRCNKSWRLRVNRMLACQLSREFSRLLRCCGPRKIAQLYQLIFRRCNFAVRCAAEFCMQQNISHLPVLMRLMTAFEENNGKYIL